MTNFFYGLGVVFAVLLTLAAIIAFGAWIENIWSKVKGAQQHKMWEGLYRQRDAECAALNLELEAFRDKEKGAPYR